MRSSPGRRAPGSSSRVTLLRRASERSANTAATTTPISTASMRSKHTVTTAVSTKIKASERVERRILPIVVAEIIRNDVTIRTAASAHSGIVDTGPVAK